MEEAGTERLTLSKEERLCGKNAISALLSKGEYGKVAGMRYCCLADNGLPYSRILISVPKKNFKRAVKRNLFKRRIRESFRKNKSILGDGTGCDILFIYTTKEILEYTFVENSVKKILSEIASKKKEG